MEREQEPKFRIENDLWSICLKENIQINALKHLGHLLQSNIFGMQYRNLR